MPSITFYDTTGRITWFMTGPDEQLDLNRQAGPHVEGQFSPDTHYVSGGAAMLRPESPVVLTGHTLTSVPTGTKLKINDATYTVNDGTAELTFSQPGTYKVRVESWPYLDKEFTVENPAP